MIPRSDFARDERDIDMSREVCDHEVFLSFTSDDDAFKFRDWLAEEGWEAFFKWAYGGSTG
jgi:hypothetical protein